MNEPRFCVVPSGFVTSNAMLRHLSPPLPAAVGGGWFSQKIMVVGWLTPIGLGATVMNKNVGTCHAGVCALEIGTVAVNTEIERSNSRAVTINLVEPIFD